MLSSISKASPKWGICSVSWIFFFYLTAIRRCSYRILLFLCCLTAGITGTKMRYGLSIKTKNRAVIGVTSCIVNKFVCISSSNGCYFSFRFSWNSKCNSPPNRSCQTIARPLRWQFYRFPTPGKSINLVLPLSIWVSFDNYV